MHNTCNFKCTFRKHVDLDNTEDMQKDKNLLNKELELGLVLKMKIPNLIPMFQSSTSCGQG